MEAIEIARRLAELGEVKDAQNAYLAALRQNVGPGGGLRGRAPRGAESPRAYSIKNLYSQTAFLFACEYRKIFSAKH